MSEEELDNYIPISEFAAINYYSPGHIGRLIRQGKLEAFKIQEKGKWLVKKDQEVKRVREVRQKKVEVVQREVSATELAKAQHWDDLSKTAQKFLDIWTGYLEAGMYVKGYITDIDSAEFEHFTLENGYRAQLLLCHLKAEFPGEFSSITEWKQLLQDSLPPGCFKKLLLVANRRTFEGSTCDICQGWS